MHILVTESIFIDEFKKFSSEHAFSRAALIDLFAHIAECDESSAASAGLELDVIAICCDFEEATADEILNEYSTGIDADAMNDDEKLEAVTKWLEGQTHVVSVNDGRIVFNCCF
jgi:hypothetical protein